MPICPFGGTEIQTGLNDGSGAFVGTPTATYVCSGASAIVDASTPDAGIGEDATLADATTSPDAAEAGTPPAPQTMFTTLGAGVLPTAVTINQGTGIGAGTGATPFMVTNLAADPNNTQTITSNGGGAPFLAKGTVPDPAFGFCDYP